MINDILESTSVQRLKGILHSRYGKGLELSFLNEVGFVQEQQGSTFEKDGKLCIPIFSNNKFLAVAKVTDGQVLPSSSKDAVTELVRLILEPALYNWCLNRQEESLIQEAKSLTEFGVESSSDSTSDSVSSPVVLLHSQNPTRTSRLAFDVHEQLGRWAFVNWNDVKSQIRTVKELRSMGAMTIFVPDILDLAPEEKDILNNWCLQIGHRADPALILGTTLSYIELSEMKALPLALSQRAGMYQIDGDRLPADRRFYREALSMLLDEKTALH
jgi:hypothetical protein